MKTFFSMGGYAWYVWPAYLCVAAVFITNLSKAYQHLRQQKRLIKPVHAPTS